MERKELNKFEREVLLAAKTYYGKQWRAEIAYRGWFYGNYMGFDRASDLQAIRNDPSRGWNIDKVKV